MKDIAVVRLEEVTVGKTLPVIKGLGKHEIVCCSFEISELMGSKEACKEFELFEKCVIVGINHFSIFRAGVSLFRQIKSKKRYYFSLSPVPEGIQELWSMEDSVDSLIKGIVND